MRSADALRKGLAVLGRAVKQPLAWLLPFGTLLSVWVAYDQGVTGELFYDDLSFLGPLASMDSFEAVKLYIADGAGGPLGRRIALLSFLPHADGWPASAIDARRVNVLIHLVNGGLLFAVGYLVLRLRASLAARTCYWVAFAAASLWLVMPILASTSLITVQRWTGLSAMFGLMGLGLFVYGYFLQERRPRQAILLQGAGLGLGTLLAILTKESGALFPIYALVIDRVLLAHLPGPAYVRRIRRVVLWLGLAAILLYLSPLHLDWFAYSAYRGWSSFERLLTQPVVLWQYLHWTFFPQPTVFGPFHDDVELVRDWLAPTMAIASLMGLTLLALLLRKRSPWLLFALMWFFTGHLIESTVIHLELVFEHRNYIAIYGFCLALAATAWQLPDRYARLGPVLFAVYGMMLWAILYGTTSIWGNSLEAAENWAKRYPASPRAILHLSRVYHQELGNWSYSLPALDRAADGCPRCTDIRMQAMLYTCGLGDEADTEQRFNRVLQSAKDGRTSVALLDSFYPLQELIADDACRPLTAADIRKLVLTLLDNPAYAAWEYQVHLSFHAAYFAREAGDPKAAEAHLARAEALRPQVMQIRQMQVHMLMKEGRYEEALSAIGRRRALANRDRFMSDSALDDMADTVHKAAAADVAL